MTMNGKVAYSLGMDAANKQMRADGRTEWNEEDYNLGARTQYEAFPPCAEGFVDVCKCSKHISAHHGIDPHSYDPLNGFGH